MGGQVTVSKACIFVLFLAVVLPTNVWLPESTKNGKK